MRQILLLAVVFALALSHPALAKKTRQQRHHMNDHVAPTVSHAPPYDWQAGDCDITNKTSLNTCTNGGR
jgi:hypothetical protein